MALSLSAEQKSLMTLFTTRDKYIIPSYQRPYSWDYEQCLKLYSDIIDAFNADNDYFLGNIIISRSNRSADEPQIVDGQQRIITLWIIFKVLSVLMSELKVLTEATTVLSWDGNTTDVKICSEVFEADDNERIKNLATFDEETFRSMLQNASTRHGIISTSFYKNPIYTNSLYFFKWFDEFVTEVGRNKVKKFIEYMLKRVYLLPIELSGNTQRDADEKALVIFETINNRGRDLENADIFKAKLYGKAMNDEERSDFIRQWVEFKSACERQRVSIDDVFRFYSHIIRGEAGITSAEKNLRDFFEDDSNSPLISKAYKEVMDDLMYILEILEGLYNKSIQETQLAAWIQLVYAYSNVYPLYAVVVYVYENGMPEDETAIEDMVLFLQKLLRYCYFQGATTMVKFEIYNIIRQIAKKLPIKDYYNDFIPSDHFNYLGRLKYGYALMTFYLTHDKGLPDYAIDKILTTRDMKDLDSSWDGHIVSNYLDALGNFIVLDCSKKNKEYATKRKYYCNNLKTKSTKEFFSINKTIGYSTLKDRNDRLLAILTNFFKCKNEQY